LEHGLDVENPRYVGERDRLVREQAGREDGQCPVLVAGDLDVPVEGLPPFDDEGLHDGVGDCCAVHHGTSWRGWVARGAYPTRPDDSHTCTGLGHVDASYD